MDLPTTVYQKVLVKYVDTYVNYCEALGTVLANDEVKMVYQQRHIL